MVFLTTMSFVMLFVIMIFTLIIIFVIIFLPAGEPVDICSALLDDKNQNVPNQENFTSSICSKKNKIDSMRGNAFFENASDMNYTSEMKNSELMQMFKKYLSPRTLDMSLMTLDIDKVSSKTFTIYLQNEITRWFFEKNDDLKDFRCVLVVPKMIHKYDSIEPNENISFSTEALIHRQSKNIGKHLHIEGEILQNKLHVNFIKIIGSVHHDNLFFDKFNTFSSTSAPYTSIYDYYRY